MDGLFYLLASLVAAGLAVAGKVMERTVDDPGARDIWHVITTAATIALGVTWGITISAPRLFL